ncbi:MAG: ABC transporter substrate-binding protein [Campylobacterales bacterium]|nr:ABC transporter substrate-binding protein [Campylobacterales bacterium]
MKLIKYIIFIALLLNITTISANETSTVEKEFIVTFDNIITIVKDKSLDKDTRNKNIVSAIDPIFDFELMAKLSLGKQWNQLNDSQQKEFVVLYVNRMKNSYSKKIDGFADEKVTIDNIQQVNKSRIIIDTQLVGSGEPIKITYKYYKTKEQKLNKKQWLVYDVIISGISIIKSDIAQFSSILQRDTITTLMDKMRD